MNKPVLRDYQTQGIGQVRYCVSEGDMNILFVLATGGGKCLAFGTEVLLADGKIKEVQDLKEGDLLMGIDSKPRKIVNTCFGREMLYEIVPVKGEPWICNESHVLSLRSNYSKYGYKKGQVVNISVREYLELNKSKKHVLKLYRTGIDFEEKNIEIDPYYLGIWLGDGHSGAASVTNIEPEVASFIEDYAAKLNLNYKARKDPRSTAVNHAITRRKGGDNSTQESLTSSLKKLGVLNNKFIPWSYLINSRKNRLELLAGLIDSDGYLHHGHYEICSVHKILAKGILYLCRSLGFAAYCKEKPTSTRKTYRIIISGNVSEIPCKVERKKAAARMINKDVLNVGFSIRKKEKGNYYGFELEGKDRLFLLSDFTVTHNTSVASSMILSAATKGKKILFIAHRRELILQARDRLLQFGVHAGVIMGSKHRYQGDSVNVASIQTLNNREFPEADIVFIDEAHHCVLTGGRNKKDKNLPVWHQDSTPTEEFKPSMMKKFFDHYNQKALIIGLTATPKRLDGKPLGDVFRKMVIPEVNGETVDIGWLQREGYLVEAKYYGAPIVADLKGVDLHVQSQIAAAFDKKELYIGVVSNYQKFAAGKKAICFCVNIEHAKKTVQEFLDNNIKADLVEGTMNESDRVAALERFRLGYTDVLCNVGILTEGYDLADIECVIANRATDSESLWLQIIGRGLRATVPPYPTKEERLQAIANSKKPYVVILDHGSNCRRLGFAEDSRDYSLEGRKKKKGVAPVKECPICGKLLPASSASCECSFEFPISCKTKKELEAEFINLSPNQRLQMLPDEMKNRPVHTYSIKELEIYRNTAKKSLGWLIHKIFDKAEFKASESGVEVIYVLEKLLKIYADIENPFKKKYKYGWILMQLEKYKTERINEAQPV